MTTERSTAVERAMALENGDDDVANVIKQMFPIDGTLWMKSEISPNLILPLARAGVIYDATKCKMLKNYIDKLLMAMISKDRQGRHEMLEAVSVVKGAVGGEDNF